MNLKELTLEQLVIVIRDRGEQYRDSMWDTRINNEYQEHLLERYEEAFTVANKTIEKQLAALREIIDSTSEIPQP